MTKNKTLNGKKAQYVTNKKAQYAVPAILLAMIALLMVYLILVYPSERAELLGENISENNVTESPLGAGTEVIFSSGAVSEVGRASGETVFDFEMNDFYVAYPAKEKTIDSREVNLKASVFKGDDRDFSANNLNLENTKEVVVRLNITKAKGEPLLSVMLNDSKIFERTVKEGLINVKIPKTMLEENNPISLKIKHKGMFWTSNELKIDAEIVQVFYNPEKPIQEQVITLGESNIKGNEIRLSFYPAETKTEGDLIAKINDKMIFSGEVPENKTFTISQRFDESGIKVGDNVFTFEADKGGVYNSTDVELEFVAVSAPATKKVYNFDINKEDLESNKDILIGIKIGKTIKPGYLSARIGDDGPTYYFKNEELTSNAWSYAELDKDYLKELGNKIVVDSPNGRYQMSGFTIILK